MKKGIKIFSVILIMAIVAFINFISINVKVKKDFTLHELSNQAQACEERVGGSQILLMIYCSGVYQVWNPETQCYDTVEYSGCFDSNSTC